MVNITFASGHTYSALDGSTYSHMSFVMQDWASIDALAAEFTIENMHTVTIGEELFVRLVPMTMTATLINESVRVVMTARELTETELMQETISDLTDAVAELGDIVLGGME